MNRRDKSDGIKTKKNSQRRKEMWDRGIDGIVHGCVYR